MSLQILKEIEKGNVAAVKRLLIINPNSVLVVNPGEERTPLHIAALLGHSEIVKELLGHGAKFEAQDKYGNTSLHLACESGNLSTVKCLLGAGRKVTLRTRNRDGQTPLHMAAKAGSVPIVKALVSGGARLDAKNKEGQTAYDLVPEDQREELAVLITEIGSRNNHSRVSPSPRRNARWSPKSSTGSGKQALDRSQSSPATSASSSPKPSAKRNSDGLSSRENARRQVEIHEVAIHGLQSELQDLGERLDTIEEYFHEKKDTMLRTEHLFTQFETHERQIVELDQRLSFQEAHMREMRPQIAHLGDESRMNSEQYQHMKQMVDMWRESVRSSLERVLDRVKEWEGITARWKEEKMEGNGIEPKQEVEEQVRKLEKQLSLANGMMSQVQMAAAATADLNSEFGKKLVQVESRLVRVESVTEEVENRTVQQDHEEISVAPSQMKEMGDKIERLQVQLEKSICRADKVEEMYGQKLKLEHSRRQEQDRELSERESKILDLRRIALEEEQQRRILFDAQEEQKARMEALEEKMNLVLMKSEQDEMLKSAQSDRIKELESCVQDLTMQLAEQSVAKKQGGCCLIS